MVDTEKCAQSFLKSAKGMDEGRLTRLNDKITLVCEAVNENSSEDSDA